MLGSNEVLEREMAKRRRASRTIRQSEEKYRVLFESSLDASFLGLPDGVIIAANPAACKVFGMSEAEICQVGRDGLIDPDDPRVGPAITERRVKGRIRKAEIGFIRKDGERFSGEVDSVILATEPPRTFSIVRDITERKRGEEALQHNERKYRHIFETNMSMMMVSSLTDGRVIDANRTFYQVLGHTPQKVIGKTTEQIGFWADLEDRKRLVGRLQTDIRLECEEVNIRTNTGKKLVALVSATLTDIAGERCIISSFIDITDRKQLEKQLRALNEELERSVEKRTLELQESQRQVLHAEKLSAIGRLSASIAHEFNSPLQGVMTILKTFKHTIVLQEQDRVLLELAFSETERMKNLIRNLQDFNRPSSGRKVFMDVHATIDSLLLLSKSELRRKGILTVIRYAERLPQICAIPDQIKQVLINLLQNAADACHGGKGVITIRTYHEDDKVAVAIQDNGIGIAPDNLSRIFQPFYTTKSEVKGTGLGLSICHGIVQNHQGEIRVESESGKGSLFTVLLPIVGEDAQS